MASRELHLKAFRLLVRFSLLASIGLVVLGMYLLLPLLQSGEVARPSQTRVVLGILSIAAGVAALVPSQVFRIRSEEGAENNLVLLSKPNCSLCDEAREVLRIGIEGTPFKVQEINIEDHGSLRRRYKNFIPVLLYEGDELFRLRFSVEELRPILDRILAERGLPPAVSPTASDSTS